MHRKKFEKDKATRASQPLQLVDSNLMGPFQTKSLGGASYILTFIDDFSRMTFGYLLEHKDQTFKSFKFFKAFVENQTNLKIKMLRSDNGGDYSSNEFNEFCAKYGIKRQFMIPYTPHQNGVAERKNRIIMGMARCMLDNLPKFLWGEAVSIAIYILNRYPIKVIHSKTPFEAWSGRKPNISHPRVFGCEAFSYIISEKRKKLNQRAKKCIFVGYDSQHRGYRLYSPSYKAMLVSRDVKFNELTDDSTSKEDVVDLKDSSVAPS